MRPLVASPFYHFHDSRDRKNLARASTMIIEQHIAPEAGTGRSHCARSTA
jgi:hypothetical protein